MISMPGEYKQSMSRPDRNRSHMLVTIGVINQKAQKGAAAVEEMGAHYSYLSNLERPLNNYDVDPEYVSLEQDWYKLDGSMLFPPRPEEADYLMNNGIISEDLRGPICFRFDQSYDIRGLTVDFGRCYPVDFTISNGQKSITILGNDKDYWTTEEIFDGTEYLLITPITMVNGEARLRIHKIMMGIGISFENRKIVSSSKDEYLSPITEELPTVDFSIEVENKNRMFDVENKASAINYLEVGQEVEVRYGYEITDGGPVTWMDGCVCDLSDWEADDETMSFSAKDKIDALDDTYYRGLYRPEGISLYDLAIDVLTDAGLDERKYELDQYLKTVTVKNPLPCVTHKECLQIIANAGRCKLYTDRKGIICIKAAFLTVVSPDRMLVQSESATKWSNLQSVVNGDVQYEYVTFSQDHYRMDGTMYFLPRNAPYLTAGFVSEAVADSSGDFAVNPRFSIVLEAAAVYYSLKLNFASNPAQGVTIHTYYEGELKESYAVSGEIGKENLIEHEFPMFDTIEFEFTKGRPDSRIFVESVVFGDVTDYRMDYKVMTKTPKGKQNEKVSRVKIAMTRYGAADDTQNITKETADLTNLEQYTFYFSEASYDIVATIGNTVLPVIDSSSYFVTVDVSGFTGVQEISVDGKVYRIITRPYELQIGNVGTIEQWENPLIDTEELAGLLGEWIGNYFSNNVEYDISYRGEPRLDAGDIVFLENPYVNGLQIQIYEHRLSFNGALSGSVKARRAMNNAGGDADVADA